MTKNELKQLWFSIPKQDKVECKLVVVNTKSNEIRIVSDVDNYYHSVTLSEVSNPLNYALELDEYKTGEYQLVIK